MAASVMFFKFYVFAAFMVGWVMAASPQAVVDDNGNELPYQYLTKFVVFGLCWPVVLYKILRGRSPF